MTTTTAGVDTWEMVMAHRLYRREFRILPAIIRGIPDGDHTRAALVGDHLDMVTTMLHHHHEAEDELLWPIMLDRVGLHADVVHRMESQHERLEGLLDRLGELNARWRATATAEVRDELADVLAQASPALDEHLDDEERDLLPLVPPHVSQQEWDALNARARGAGPKDLRTAFAALGAMLEDATPEEQRRFLAELPPPVRLLWRLFGRRSWARSRDAVRRGR
ncbi:hemerythrin domain-containing protein [Catenuloplanes atrovinosus]|uniref:Hemerythrin-like domain-containing protein n=1 Tax=Catenuloplanes atrovinosus TaxID=137266 RepID=A0AAE3YUU8_9ACTN|nr:hemerythrin domain-containing protein [Catenuloplanes atrovinosus]MDR7279592.1 hemerythrin-like domain-containing protein [Catenuloplanes atrovinosus]